MEIGNLVEDTNLEATKIDQTELHVATESLHTHKPLNDQPSRFSSSSSLKSFKCLGLSLSILLTTPKTSLDFWIRKFYYGSLQKSMNLALSRGGLPALICHVLQHRTLPPPVINPPSPLSRYADYRPLTSVFSSLCIPSNFGDPENSLRDHPRAGVAR